jgi:hypothetical protein
VGLGGKDICGDEGPEGVCISGVMAEKVGGICHCVPTSASLLSYENISEIPGFVYQGGVYGDWNCSEGVIGWELIHVEC